MKNGLVPVNVALTFTKRISDLCACLHLYNQLRDYKLTDAEIIEWAETIERIGGDCDVEKLRYAIDAMVAGWIDYDRSVGIQNIFRALKEVIVDENGKFKLRSKMRW